MALNTDIYTRTCVITLKSPPIGKTTSQVSYLTGVNPRTVDRIYSRAIAAGFEPNDLPLKILPHHVQDSARSGRLLKQTQEVKEEVIQHVQRDRYGREKTCADVAGSLSVKGIDISASTVWRVLREAGFHKTKPTRKPGLTQKMRDERYKWALDHKDWTLEDWKNVVWTDETSVVLGHRRGGYRVWRKPEERAVKSCIRERWKGYSEFMFWGCFTYDRKGPCHIYRPETKLEREAAARTITQLNAELEPVMREEWELSTAMNRIGLSNKPGRKPAWRWTEKNGKLVRSSGSGIDWWRYQTCVLLPKLIPFAQECAQDRPRTVVMEDKAPAHAHHYQNVVYSLYKVQKLLWCGNSPDCNCIEPCWFYMKKETTKKGAPQSRADAARAWERCWRDIPQSKIQAWIERMLVHIPKIIDLCGGNEYIEGIGSRRVRAEG